MTEFTSVVSILSILVGVLAVGIALATVTLTALHRMERRIDQRISRLEAHTNQRFDQTDRRIDELQAQTNERFDRTDRRIDELQAQTNERFDRTDRRIDHLAERVAGFEVGQARVEGQLDVIRETLLDRAAAVPEQSAS